MELETKVGIEAVDALIGEIVAEVEVAPSLRDRARSNLVRLYRSSGESALKGKLEAARENCAKAVAYLESVADGQRISGGT